ncbi:LysE family translocator [Dasania marina]|uniref:LysE family translocator n=1 Tax=Dasania marina TaxID=471499 RepID=UPI0004784B22|nr:LysE family translocator [Dasania marina]
MTLTQWSSLLLVCALGAAMPGPSLAVVVQNTLRGGFSQGAVTALFHALGVGVYALLTVTGLAVLMLAMPTVFWLIKIAGALYLIYLGFNVLRAANSPQSGEQPRQQATVSSAREGFFIAFLNPKLLIFFTALFSQFLHADLTWLHKGILVATVTVVDGLWYCLVALLSSQGFMQQRFAEHTVWLQRLFAAVLVLVGLRLIFFSL